MRKAGTIYLYYRYGELVTARQYFHPSGRNIIIAHWKKMYAAAFKHCFLQIVPEVNPLFVNARGENTKYEYEKNFNGAKGARPK